RTRRRQPLIFVGVLPGGVSDKPRRFVRAKKPVGVCDRAKLGGSRRGRILDGGFLSECHSGKRADDQGGTQLRELHAISPSRSTHNLSSMEILYTFPWGLSSDKHARRQSSERAHQAVG